MTKKATHRETVNDSENSINIYREIIVEDAKIIWKNFSGKTSQFNPMGKRTFTVLIETEKAKVYQADGWNIKWLKPLEEGDPEQAALPVEVSFKQYAPTILMITDNGKVPIDEETVGMLDWADIASMDIMLNPYHWNVNGKEGIKAYLKKMYVIIREDVLDKKYSDVNFAISSEDPQLEDDGIPF